MDYTSFLERTLNQAASIAMQHFGKVTTTVKPDDNNQVLTEADIAIGKFVVGEIQSKFPDHNIIDEEAGVIDKKSKFTWVVDPVDGTSNFAAGLSHFGIMIGLLDGGTPIAGGVSSPAFGKLYLAEKGNGSFCNGERLHVTNEPNLLNVLVAYGIDGHQENPELTLKECETLARIVLGVRNIRNSGCEAYDTVMLAAGKYGACLNKTSKIWDNVAPQIIVEEAGGKWTDFEGRAIDYSNPISKADLNYTHCSAAPALHEQLQKIIHSN